MGEFRIVSKGVGAEYEFCLEKKVLWFWCRKAGPFATLKELEDHMVQFYGIKILETTSVITTFKI